MKYYLIKESGSNIYSNNENPYLILDGQWEKGTEVVELTEEEIQCILQVLTPYYKECNAWNKTINKLRKVLE